MPSPSEYFVKYLISRDEFTPQTIQGALEDYGLGTGINPDYIRKLQKKLGTRPDPFVTTGITIDQRNTKEWLKSHGIYGLWYPSKAVEEAYGILGKVGVRADLEALLLSPLRVEDVTKRINKHFNLTLSVEGVEAFGHYFWDKNLLTMPQWVSFLTERGEGIAGAERALTSLRAAPDVAHLVVPWVTGMSGPPANLNTGFVARRMRDTAFMKVLETERDSAGLNHSKMMKNYMDVIKIAENEMRQSDVALKDVLKAFEKFRMRRDDKEIPSIEEVAGMNYSQSGGGTDDRGGGAEVILEEMKDE
jgi:hypothetical protein